MKKLVCSLITLCICSLSFAQEGDDLWSQARSAKTDSLQFELYRKSAFHFIFNDGNKAIQVIEEGLSLAQKKENELGVIKLLNTKGIYMDVNQKRDSAKFYFLRALELSREKKFPNQEASATNNLGMYHWNSGMFEEALKYFFQALELNEAHGDKVNNAKYLNNIGLIYQEMMLLEKSLEFHEKSLALRKEFGLLDQQPASLNNMGICLTDLKRYQEAETAFNEGLAIAEQVNNQNEYYRILENLGYLYMTQDKNEQAEAQFQKALNRPDEVSQDSKSQLIIYGHLIGLYNKMNQLGLAREYVQKADQLLQTNPDLKTYADHVYANAVESHYRTQNYTQARSAFLNYTRLKDSLFSKESAAAVADMEVRYDTQKKEKQLLQQRVEMAEKDLTIQRKEYQLIGLIALLLLIGIIGYLIYNQQQIKHLQFKKEAELSEAMALIETQNKMQEQRLRISRDLHDNIGSQLTFIISSLDQLSYGGKLQQAEEERLGKISGFTRNTIRELRDTIWAMNKSDMTFEDLQGRISNFLQQAEDAEERISFSFEADPVLSSMRLTSLQAMNVYRIIQEGINNAIKHSEAQEVRVTAQWKEGLECRIVDNGNGFGEEINRQGNGLLNLRKRAQDLGAEVHIESSDNGTLIQVAGIKLTEA